MDRFKKLNNIVDSWSSHLNGFEKKDTKELVANRLPHAHKAEHIIREVHNTNKYSHDEVLVVGARVVCSCSMFPTDKVKMYKPVFGNSEQQSDKPFISPLKENLVGKASYTIGISLMQFMRTLTHKDTNFEPYFTSCKTTQGNICNPIILNDEWQEYDEDNYELEGEKKRFGLLKENAFMICTSGLGLIYAADNGQQLPELELQIEEWLMAEKPYLDIPQDGRKLGTIISYMSWKMITNKTSPQYALKKHAEDNGRYFYSHPEYYAMIDNRMLIATRENIGEIFKVKVGDYANITFEAEDGTITIQKCIIGDIKGADAGHTWGHYEGKGVVEIIYNDYESPEGYNNISPTQSNNPWGKGKVLRITVVGNYYDE